MNILQKLQNLPEYQKKVILWAVVILAGIGLLLWWARGVGKKVRELQNIDIKKEIPLPDIKGQLPEFPEIEFPPVELPPSTKNGEQNQQIQPR